MPTGYSIKPSPESGDKGASRLREPLHLRTADVCRSGAGDEYLVGVGRSHRCQHRRKDDRFPAGKRIGADVHVESHRVDFGWADTILCLLQ